MVQFSKVVFNSVDSLALHRTRSGPTYLEIVLPVRRLQVADGKPRGRTYDLKDRLQLLLPPHERILKKLFVGLGSARAVQGGVEERVGVFVAARAEEELAEDAAFSHTIIGKAQERPVITVGW